MVTTELGTFRFEFAADKAPHHAEQFMARARQGYRTAGYPAQEPVMPALFRGRPELDPEKDPAAFARCGELCPTGTASFFACSITDPL